MFSYRLYLLGCLLLPLWLAGREVNEAAEAKGRKPARKQKNAATPKEAVELYAKAVKNGDVDGALNQLDELPRRFFRLVVASKRARINWEAAADKKFGKGKRKRDIALFEPEDIEVLSEEKKQEGVVLLKCKLNRTKERFYWAIKEGAAWELFPPVGEGGKPEDAHPRKWEELLDHFDETGVKEQVVRVDKETRAIRAGKYRTRAEAEKALRGALKKRFRNKVERALADCVALAARVEKYRVDHGDPSSLQDLVTNGAIPADKLNDPWGKPYQLDLNGRKARVFTVSPKTKLIESGPAGG
jgi:hypothetical protein